MTGHLCTFDDLGQFRSGTNISKHLQLGLGIPLLVDVHAVWFDWVCGDDEVAATWTARAVTTALRDDARKASRRPDKM